MKQVEIRRIQTELCAQVIGAILLLWLGRMLGDQGVTYLAIAVNTFALVWSLTGNYTADTLGRMLRTRISRGQYRGADRLRRTILLTEVALGVIGCLIMVLFAQLLSERLFGGIYCKPLLLVLAPVVLLRGISSALLGWLKGDGTELPTVIVCVARQLFTASFAILFGKILWIYGAKVSKLLGVGTFTAMYGGMGVAVGILLSELLCVLFLWLVYRASRGGVPRERTEAQRANEGTAEQVRAFAGMAAPQLARGVLVTLPIWFGMVLLAGRMPDSGDFTEMYGLFIGKYAPLVCICFLPLAALLIENIARTAQSLRRDEHRTAQRFFLGGLHGAIVRSLFLAVFMAVTAPHLADWLCLIGEDETAAMLRAGAFVLPLALLGFYFTRLLFVMGSRSLALAGMLIADLVYAIAALAALKAGSGAIALICAGLIAGAAYAAGTGFLVVRRMDCRIDWVQTAVLPAVCSCLIGLAVLFLANALAPHLGSGVTVILLLILSYVLYWGALLFLRSFREQDMAYFPGGRLLALIGRTLRAF